MLRPLSLIGPGLLLAATGVGAGDLATGAFAGAKLGTAVLWAVALGALLKFSLNEGLARLQLASGQTIFVAVSQRLGRWPLILFLPYLLLWSYFVGAALISACGVAGHALIDMGLGADAGKRWLGAAQALIALALVWLGGFALFERLMKLFVGLMFAVVLLTAVQLWPGSDAVLGGLFLPRIPAVPEALDWTLALMGGVGGTVTVLCYGYWIREAGRTHADDLKSCRYDLAAAYGMTAIFGLAMVIIGSTVTVEGRGAGLIIVLADSLALQLGPVARQLFLIGAWGAMFSSLLGVLQAVPYLWADLIRALLGQPGGRPLRETRSYLWALLLLACVPMLGLGTGFAQIQKFYAIAGALFMPALALLLLWLNNRLPLLGNRWLANAGLLLTLLCFSAFALY